VQIRVHLRHLGWPIVGDATYGADNQLGEVQTLAIEDAPLCLHAWQLTFSHPQHGQRVTFEAPKPAWVLCKLFESPEDSYVVAR